MSSGFDIAFVTLGCAKNEVDSDKMRAKLLAAGFTIVEEAADADLVIVNTCSFLMSAVDEGLEVIFDLVKTDDEGAKPAKVLVAGCMPARYGKDLESELTEVAGFLSAAEEDKVVEKVTALLGARPAPASGDMAAFYQAHVRDERNCSAYVKISDGCDRFCSYCMIPYIRGRYRSYEIREILAEVAELVDDGVREIVFIGQDTGIWGHDLDVPLTTAGLLKTAAERFPQTWFRLLYLQPEGISDELLDVMASHDNICSYIDMPLQHANESVLRLMNRSGSAPEFLDLIAHMREKVPGLVLRSTFIAGFPQESEEQFEELEDFIEAAEFDYAVVFPYSQEEGSAAAKLEGQVDEDVRMERAQRVLDLCDAVGHAKIASHIGETVEALVEGFEQTDVGVEALCRWKGQAPEVDGQIHVPVENAEDVGLGDVLKVKLVDTFFYEFEGELA